MNTRPLSHRIRYTSTGPLGVTSAAPSPPLHSCAAAIFSTVTDDTPDTNGTASIGAPCASTSCAGNARDEAAATGSFAIGAIGVRNAQPLNTIATRLATTSVRFMMRPIKRSGF
jgi:hypothetical protein